MSEMNLEGARLILEGWAGNPNEKAAVRRVFDELKRREWEAEAWRMSYMAMREARDLAREERDLMRRHGIERSDAAPAHSVREAENKSNPADGTNNEIRIENPASDQVEFCACGRIPIEDCICSPFARVLGTGPRSDRAPMVDTAHGRLLVGTRLCHATDTGNRIFVLTTTHPFCWQEIGDGSDRGVRGLDGEIIPPLAHDSLGYPLYKGDRVEWIAGYQQESGTVLRADHAILSVRHDGPDWPASVDYTVDIGWPSLRKIHEPS